MNKADAAAMVDAARSKPGDWRGSFAKGRRLLSAYEKQRRREALAREQERQRREESRAQEIARLRAEIEAQEKMLRRAGYRDIPVSQALAEPPPLKYEPADYDFDDDVRYPVLLPREAIEACQRRK